MEELKLDLIMVDSSPNSISKFHLFYRDGTATGMARVYSFDEEWYYLYKRDTEKYKVKRRKDLEGIKPSFTYNQKRKRHAVRKDKEKDCNGKKVKIAENGGNLVMESNNRNDEVQKYFGDKFSSTASMSRFDVIIDHFSKKFSISGNQAKEAYEKTCKLFEEGKIERFPGYFAAICKSMSSREYSPEQTRKYIEYNIHQRKEEQLKDFMQKYENGERRMFAPHFGITKKEHNQMAYEAARLELEARRNQPNAPDKTLERSMGSP